MSTAMASMETETAEQLRAKIAAALERSRQEDETRLQLLREVEEAKERQALREELESIEDEIARKKGTNSYHSYMKRLIDNNDCDRDLHNPEYISSKGKGGKGKGGGKGGKKGREGRDRLLANKSCGSTFVSGDAVRKGSFEWKIQGMSWLLNALRQNGTPFAESPTFVVGEDDFDLVYSPTGERLIDEEEDEDYVPTGSLAIRHLELHGVTFRYRFFIKSTSGDFSPWGDEGDECHPDWESLPKAFGPDTQDSLLDGLSDRQVGIFGLSHVELLKSEWIQNDTLHVKVEVELKEDTPLDSRYSKLDYAVEVPPGTLDINMVALLDSGNHGDVTFLFEGDRVTAHAGVLSARSEVFASLLSCGMHESISREIVIEDCTVAVFKLLLKFIYTDNLDLVADDLRGATATQSQDSDDAHIASSRGNECSQNMMLQSLLAQCHKYQVGRLRCWCEQQLCKCISVDDVCHILNQAHLYEAKSLERSCLAFVKAHFRKVVRTAAFGCLAEAWPEVMLKINMSMADIPENDAAEALQEARRKRQKRGMNDVSKGA